MSRNHAPVACAAQVGLRHIMSLHEHSSLQGSKESPVCSTPQDFSTPPYANHVSLPPHFHSLLDVVSISAENARRLQVLPDLETSQARSEKHRSARAQRCSHTRERMGKHWGSCRAKPERARTMDVTNPPEPAACLPPASGAPASVSSTSPTTPSPRACIPSTTKYALTHT